MIKNNCVQKYQKIEYKINPKEMMWNLENWDRNVTVTWLVILEDVVKKSHDLLFV